MTKTILNWILARASFSIYLSEVALGTRLGGADILGVRDKYLILTISLRKQKILAFTGHWRLS